MMELAPNMKRMSMKVLGTARTLLQSSRLRCILQTALLSQIMVCGTTWAGGEFDWGDTSVK